MCGFRYQLSKIEFMSELRYPGDDYIDCICIAGPVYAFFNQVEIVCVAVWWSINPPTKSFLP